MNKNNYQSLDNFYNNNILEQNNHIDKEKIKYSDKDIERNDKELLKPEKYDLDISYKLRFNMNYSKMIPDTNNKNKFYDNNRYMTENIKRVPLDISEYKNPQNMVGRGFGVQSYPDSYGIYTRQLDQESNPRSIIYENRNFDTNKNLLYGNYIEDNDNRGGLDTRYLNKKSQK